MIQALKNIPLKFKLITCFLLIISINGISGLMGLRLVKHLGNLVTVTYDKALMSGTFAQAAKFDFSQFDGELKTALLTMDTEVFQKALARSEKNLKTLLDDLAVVEERALDEKSQVLIKELREKLAEIVAVKVDLVSKKQLLLANSLHQEDALGLLQTWDDLKLKRSLYRKLTALYDQAAEVGYSFRMDSEEDNRKNFTRSLWTLLICLVVSLSLSIGVSVLIIAPLLRLQQVVKTVGRGDYTVRSELIAKDELGSLSSALNFMLDTIQDKTESITSLLAALPFGLFSFDKDGLISRERSQNTDVIFRNFPKYLNLKDFFADHHCSTKQTDAIIQAIFQELIPFESAVFLFPDSVQTSSDAGPRTIQLSFKPRYELTGKLSKVLILAEDVTEKNLALEESRVLTERVQRVSKISSEIDSFKEFTPAVEALFMATFAHLEKPTETWESDLKRDLHSLKGLLGIFAYDSCSTLVHEIEELLESDSNEKDELVLKAVKKVHHLFSQQTQDIVDLLALYKEEGFKSYDIQKIGFVRSLARELQNKELETALESLDRFPVHKVLAKYSAYAQSLARKLEDKSVTVTFDPNSPEITYEEVQRLDTVFVHILRNSVDHGIETSSERIEKNKNAAGEIRISCRRTPTGSLRFKFSDDGRGIDGRSLEKKALMLGLITPEKAAVSTDEDRTNLIFISGISSKEEVTEISGRGVGMDAVKNYVESLGGSVYLFTELGVGTTFSFIIPPFDMA